MRISRERKSRCISICIRTTQPHRLLRTSAPDYVCLNKQSNWLKRSDSTSLVPRRGRTSRRSSKHAVVSYALLQSMRLHDGAQRVVIVCSSHDSNVDELLRIDWSQESRRRRPSRSRRPGTRILSTVAFSARNSFYPPAKKIRWLQRPDKKIVSSYSLFVSLPRIYFFFFQLQKGIWKFYR